MTAVYPIKTMTPARLKRICETCTIHHGADARIALFLPGVATGTRRTFTPHLSSPHGRIIKEKDGWQMVYFRAYDVVAWLESEDFGEFLVSTAR